MAKHSFRCNACGASFSCNMKPFGIIECPICKARLVGKLPAVASTQAEHDESPDCWCDPKLIYVDEHTGQAVYVHKAIH